MKYVIIILVVIIVVCLAARFILPDDRSAGFTKAVSKQENPFTLAKDSANAAWGRARAFITDYRRSGSISGGKLQACDTLLYIPYVNNDPNSNTYHRGTSILIHRKDSGNSTHFNVEWYYSKAEQTDGEKELAYFMATGKSKFDKK